MDYVNYNNSLMNLKKIASSRHVFNHYVAKQFANTIANVAPKIDFQNEQLNNLWQDHKTINNFTKLNYEIVRLCSLHGLVFVGIVPTSNKSNSSYLPSITIGIPLDYEYVGFELTKLVMVIDIIKRNQSSFFVVEQ